jgi:hypothetical protein
MINLEHLVRFLNCFLALEYQAMDKVQKLSNSECLPVFKTIILASVLSSGSLKSLVSKTGCFHLCGNNIQKKLYNADTNSRATLKPWMPTLFRG